MVSGYTHEIGHAHVCSVGLNFMGTTIRINVELPDLTRLYPGRLQKINAGIDRARSQI